MRSRMIHDVRASMQDILSFLEMIKAGYRLDDEDAPAIIYCFSSAVDQLSNFVDSALTKYQENGLTKETSCED